MRGAIEFCSSSTPRTFITIRQANRFDDQPGSRKHEVGAFFSKRRQYFTAWLPQLEIDIVASSVDAGAISHPRMIDRGVHGDDDDVRRLALEDVEEIKSPRCEKTELRAYWHCSVCLVDVGVVDGRHSMV
jgi:hypothetical protein